jgi:hypothetical protein
MEELFIVIDMFSCARTGVIVAPPKKAAAASILKTTIILNLFMHQWIDVPGM